MLFMKTDSDKYISEFKGRFTNFAQKAPILLSFIASDKSVEVIHENSGTIYTFEWDFTLPVKSFIHEIKQTLLDNHYPRLNKVEYIDVPYTSEEIANMAAEGADLLTIPVSRVVKKEEMFVIDKVIALKDIFIIKSEKDHKAYRYKMNYSCMFFLRNYRDKQYTLESASDFFFSKSTLLNEMTRDF